VRVPAIDSHPLRSTEDQYFSLRGGAERQGHESELDEPTAVGAASDPTKEGRAGSPPLLAVFVTFGTVNAYVAGMARVYYAAARDGVFPKMLATVDRRTGVPHHSLVFLIVPVLLSLFVFYMLAVDFVSVFLMASGAAILTYVIGSIAGIRLLKERGMRRALPWISLAVSVILLSFIGGLLAASAAIAGVGLLISWALSRRRKGENRQT